MEKEAELLPRLTDTLSWDAFAIVSLLFLATFLVDRLLLAGLAAERRALVGAQMRSAGKFGVASLSLVAAFRTAEQWFPADLRAEGKTVLVFLGLVALAVCFVWVVKIIRLGTFVASFFLSPKRPVPLLLINLITFLLGAVLALLVANDVLGVSIAPLLATSAVLSIVLGLALQDTLGNLLTGIALQIDKPFRIGDWVELQGSGLKTVGQVKEMTWRATILQSFTDEVLVIPNRTVAQSQISNYSSKSHPVLRSHVFRFPFGTNLEIARRALLEVVDKQEGIHKAPAPNFLLIENGESWVSCKLLYYIVDFGDQFLVGDKVLSGCHAKLRKLAMPLARPGFEIISRDAASLWPGGS